VACLCSKAKPRARKRLRIYRLSGRGFREQGLVSGAAKLLSPGGLLLIYGPFQVGEEITPESNVKFDQTLRDQNAEWGLRRMDLIQVVRTRSPLLEVHLHLNLIAPEARAFVPLVLKCSWCPPGVHRVLPPHSMP